MCCCALGKSQTNDSINERRGNLYFSVSPEYRITPFYTGIRTSELGSLVDFQTQNASAALNYDFNYFPLKNLALGFSHSFRYDHIVKGELSLFNDTQTIAPDENGLIMDFHFYIKYHAKIFKDSELTLLVGRSLLNTGTSFQQIRRIFNEDNEPIASISSSRSSSFWSFNLGLGWKKKRLEFLGGIYTSNTTEFLEGSTGFSIPYIRLNYTLAKL
jgi:hypothetical protein